MVLNKLLKDNPVQSQISCLVKNGARSITFGEVDLNKPLICFHSALDGSRSLSGGEFGRLYDQQEHGDILGFAAMQVIITNYQ